MDDEHKKIPGKKNKKLWCGGHVGRSHILVCKSFKEIKKWGKDEYRILVCETCGKELDTFYGREQKTPDWVVF